MTSKDPSNDKPAATTPARQPTGLVAFEDLDRWFDDLFHRRWLQPFADRPWAGLADFKAPFSGRWPKTDIIDHDQEVVVRAELPGVNKEDLNISVTGRTVTIEAKTKHETKEEQGHYFHRETSSGEYHRTLSLPDEVQSDSAKAVFKDGILELTLSKMAGAKRKTVQVE